MSPAPYWEIHIVSWGCPCAVAAGKRRRGGRGEQGVGAGGGGSARLSLVLGPQLRDIDRAQPTVSKTSHWLSRGADAKATQARAGTPAGLASAQPHGPGRPLSPTMGGLYSEYLNSKKVLEHYNYTKETLDMQETPSRKVASAFIIILCCAIVVENLLVLIAVARNSKFHSAMYLFLGNLAASDLLAGVAFVANTLLSGPVTLSLTPVQWFAREGSAFITLSASVFSLLAIAIERQVAIAKVKLYGSDKSCRMLMLIGASWLISLILGGLPILGWNCLDQLETCSTVLPLYAKHYVLCVVTIFSVILLAIVALYVRIYFVVRSSHADVAGPQTLALLKTVTIVLGVFILCWLPAFSILLLDFACPVRACPVLYKAHYFFAFATLNSLLNPVIYTWRSRDLRREVLRPLQCWRRGKGVPGRRGGNPGHRLLPLRSSSSLERGMHMPTSPTFLEGNTVV